MRRFDRYIILAGSWSMIPGLHLLGKPDMFLLDVADHNDLIGHNYGGDGSWFKLLCKPLLVLLLMRGANHNLNPDFLVTLFTIIVGMININSCNMAADPIVGCAALEALIAEMSHGVDFIHNSHGNRWINVFSFISYFVFSFDQQINLPEWC